MQHTFKNAEITASLIANLYSRGEPSIGKGWVGYCPNKRLTIAGSHWCAEWLADSFMYFVYIKVY